MVSFSVLVEPSLFLGFPYFSTRVLQGFQMKARICFRTSSLCQFLIPQHHQAANSSIAYLCLLSALCVLFPCVFCPLCLPFRASVEGKGPWTVWPSGFTFLHSRILLFQVLTTLVGLRVWSLSPSSHKIITLWIWCPP